MRFTSRPLYRRIARTAAFAAAALTVAACGSANQYAELPDIDRNRPVTLLNAKQKSQALADMGKIADEQNQRAAKIRPITYKIPEQEKP